MGVIAHAGERRSCAINTRQIIILIQLTVTLPSGEGEGGAGYYRSYMTKCGMDSGCRSRIAALPLKDSSW